MFQHSSKARTLIAATTLVVAVAATLAGCAPAGSSQSHSPGQTISIGYIGALTGDSAAIGTPIAHGAQLAVDQINASGKLKGKLKLISVDDAADPAKSTAAAQQLLSQGVVAIIGGPNSGPVQATNPIITAAGVPQVIAFAQAANLIDPKSAGFPLTYRVTENSGYDAEAIGGLFAEGHYRNICAVSDNSAYGSAAISTIQTVFGDLGLHLGQTVQHEVGASDLTSQVLTLRNAGCDAIYLADLGNDAALFIKTVNQFGWKVPILGARGLATASFLSSAGTDADGAIFPNVVDPSKKATQRFITDYDKRFGAKDDPAHAGSAMGYDTVTVIADALKRSGEKGGKALVSALDKTSISGVSGRAGSKLSFTPTKHEAPSKDFIVFWEIVDGKYQPYSDSASGK